MILQGSPITIPPKTARNRWRLPGLLAGRLVLRQNGKELVRVGIQRIEQQALFLAKGFEFGGVFLLSHVVDGVAVVTVDRVAIPVHHERLAALAVVPRLAVKDLAIEELGLESTQQVPVGMFPLQDARGLAANI